MAKSIPFRQIRAQFTDSTIRVYQAYSHEIADNALREQTFVDPFKRTRMTWIKPSFLWMMYRCGWGTKTGQERIVAVDITREGFEWALAHSCLSHFVPELYPSRDEWINIKRQSPVRIQWDPERSPRLGRLDHRSIQIGLSGQAVHKYVDKWIVNVTDLSAFVIEVREMVEAHHCDQYLEVLPKEQPYPVPTDIAERIGMTRN